VLEAAHFVDHRQATALLDQKEYRIGAFAPRMRIQCVLSLAGIASSESIAIFVPGTAMRSPGRGSGRWPGLGGQPLPGH
jgi:hypothetical protein